MSLPEKARWQNVTQIGIDGTPAVPTPVALGDKNKRGAMKCEDDNDKEGGRKGTRNRMSDPKRELGPLVTAMLADLASLRASVIAEGRGSLSNTTTRGNVNSSTQNVGTTFNGLPEVFKWKTRNAANRALTGRVQT